MSAKGLRSGQEHPALAGGVFVVECDPGVDSCSPEDALYVRLWKNVVRLILPYNGHFAGLAALRAGPESLIQMVSVE